MSAEYLPVAVRVFTERERSEDNPRKKPKAMHRELPQRVLVLDCETTIDQSQRLLFGAWRLYVDAQDAEPGSVCVEEGLFYADDLPERDPAGLATLRAHAATQRSNTSPGYRSRLRLLSRAEFMDQLVWKQGYKQQATIVGYNLPFDLTRLASHSSPARKSNRGGVSLRMWEYRGGEHPFRPRIVLRSIDAHRTLMQFTGKQEGKGPDGHPVTGHYFRGKFLDLRTLAFAHTDERALTLEAAVAKFGGNYAKRDVTHGEITDDYISYCRDDVAATAGLFRDAVTVHLRHPVALAARDTYSAATLGKAYLGMLGITPFNERESFCDPQVAGWGMAAFYGGRSECRIRKLDVPVVYCDFMSMYLTCNVLTGTFGLMRADQLTVTDNTSETRALLESDDLVERLFDRSTWPIMHTLVEVEPNGAILPVRARYDPETWGIGVNPLHATNTFWYPLGDVLAARLLGGPTPTIVRSFRINASDQTHHALRTGRLFDITEFNPLTDDLFATTVEQRHLARRRRDLGPDERDSASQFFKVLGNSTGYGILVQFDRVHLTEPCTVHVHTDRGRGAIRTDTPEVAGPYTCPPIAACVTGAARLMLALLEHEVTSAGGTYAFCDTDSMAIVADKKGDTLLPCPGGSDNSLGKPAIRTLSWRRVESIIDRFAHLNPYRPDAVPGSILRIEKENYNPGTHRQREIRCYAISAKRYQLTDRDGATIKRSEHGLGHLQNPTPGNDWISAAWEFIRNPSSEPAWLDLPALSRMTVTSAESLQWFRSLNHGKTHADRIKPWNFLLVAHRDPLDPSGAQPIAPYTRSPTDWTGLPWIDRVTGMPVTVTTRPLDGTHQADTTRIRTFRDYLVRYRQHPEMKALAPAGNAITGATSGLLGRRPVHALPTISRIGKEAHDLDDRTAGTSSSNTSVIEYTDTTEIWRELVLPVLRTIPTSRIAHDTGVHVRTVQRALTGNRKPQSADREALFGYAVDTSRRETHASRTSDARSVLYAFLQLRNTL